MKRNLLIPLAGAIVLVGATIAFVASSPVAPLETMALSAEATTTSVTRDTPQAVANPTTPLNESEQDEQPILARIEQIMFFRQEIVRMRDANHLLVTQMKLEIEDVKTLIDAFKTEGLKLNETERAWAIELRNQAKDLRESVKATIGKVYEPISQLRGQYTLENLDLIYDTYSVAYENMIIRQDALTAFNGMIIEVKDFLTIKVG
jgi:hypothetical protein